MPFIKISGLTTATAVSATNQFEINQNGASRSLQVSVLDSYIRSGSPLPVVVSVSSASDALRITQTGTGNALVVEDAANPDSTPFAVNASGQVLVGTTAAITTGVGSAAMQIFGGTAPLAFYRQADSATPINLEFAKARAAGAILASGDTIGRLYFSGSDGTAQIPAAYIDAAVDGTPGTNDMPGRLVFSTTADGASTPTERMRIDNAGDVGIGTTTPTARLNVVDASSQDAVRITQTGAGNALVIEDAANPDATPFVVEANGRLIVGATSTEPSLGTSNTPQIGVFGNSASNNGFANYSYVASTAGNFFNFVKSRSATPGTFSIVSNGDDLGYIKFIGDDGTQFLEAARIWAEVDGTPGVNDMPGRLIFSTTGDGASTPTERMRIGSTGNIGIGTAGSEPFTIRNLRNFSGATTAYGISQGGEIQSGVTSSIFVNHTAPTTQATAFTLSTLYHYSANSLTIGAGSAVTTQYGFFAGSGLTTATNNYGFYSDIASGANRWNFYANGTAANYFAGDMQLDKTVTASGTTGAQTINKNAGTVNFAAAATSLVVTNSRVTANSIIIATVATVDTTMKSVAAVAGAGSFTLTANAAAAAETRVNWLVIN